MDTGPQLYPISLTERAWQLGSAAECHPADPGLPEHQRVYVKAGGHVFYRGPHPAYDTGKCLRERFLETWAPSLEGALPQHEQTAPLNITGSSD